MVLIDKLILIFVGLLVGFFLGLFVAALAVITGRDH